MKKALIISLVLLVIFGGLFALYYFFWTAPTFSSIGAKAMAAEKYSQAQWFYEKAAELDPENPEYTVSLADAYIAGGSFSQAERCLHSAIMAQPSAPLFMKLSSVYVAQDKLLDASRLLDGITDSALKAELDALRPAAPAFSPEGGQFSEYIDVTFSNQNEKVYYSSSAQFPSVADGAFTDAFTLNAGTTYIQAISVGENGLVSSLVSQEYMVVGVVEEVHFVSAELETYIRDSLFIPRSEPVMTSDLWAVTRLELTPDVTDYSDLRYFTSLGSLVIENSVADDFSFLRNMPALTELNLRNSLVSEETLSYIGSLSLLETLDLSGCGISNLASLSALSELTVLNLSENSISDVSHLSGLAYLRELNLADNAISSLESLAKLKKLTHLDITGNSISSIDALSQCVELKSLKANGNSIQNIQVLQNAPHLARLELSGNGLSNIGTLAGCTEMLYLDLSNNQITSVDAIGAMESLTYLDISYNQVAALPQLSEASRLQQFHGAHNLLTDLSPLVGLKELATVDVDYNPELENIVILIGCPLIVQIDAFGTKVAESPDLNKMITELHIIVNYDPTVA